MDVIKCLEKTVKAKEENVLYVLCHWSSNNVTSRISNTHFEFASLGIF